MGLESLAQSAVFGIFVGSLYGMVAVGLALVFGVMKVLNIAHGELLMLGGYVAFWVVQATGMDPFASLVIVVPCLFLLGIAMDRVVYRHVVRQAGDAKLKNSLLVSFGLALIIQNLVLWLFSADERTIAVTSAGRSLEIMGISLPQARLMALLITFIVVLGLHRFLHRTHFGTAILATAEDWESAELAGINTGQVYTLTFGLSAALAAVAGALVTIIQGIAPGAGLVWTLKALIVVVLAGTGSIFGAFPAGILLGVVEALSGALIGSSSRELVGLIAFLLVLMLRPQGLFGERR